MIEKLIGYIKDEAQLNNDTLSEIGELLSHYPYSQLLHFLYLKNMQMVNHAGLNEQLCRSMAYITNKSRLYRLLHTPAPVQLTPDEPPIEPVKSDEPSDEPFPKPRLNPRKDLMKQNISRTLQYQIEKSRADTTTYLVPVMDAKVNPVFHRAEIVFLDSDHPEIPVADLHFVKVNQDKQLLSIDEPLKEGAPLDIDPKKKKTDLIIDNFISTTADTRIKVNPAKDTTEDLSAKSTQENDHYLTEKLADIFILQKNFVKAIDIYRRLSLKYPEKSVYFAAKIEETEKKLNTNP